MRGEHVWAESGSSDAEGEVSGGAAADGEGEMHMVDATDGSDAEDPDFPADADAASDAQLQEAIQRVRADRSLVPPPLPTPPTLALLARPADKLRAVQAFIERLGYNYTGTDYFDVRKNRPFARVLETARLIVRTALPIKCVEAVFVAVLLTQELSELERVPFAFKSRVDGRVAKHIVLAVRQPGVGWGALGLSRRKELYYKELGSCAQLSDLYVGFLRGYEAVCHRLVRVRVGLPVPHDSFSAERLCWAYRSLSVRADDAAAHADVCAQLNAFARSAPKLAHAWRASGGAGAGAAGGAGAPAPATAGAPGEAAAAAAGADAPSPARRPSGAARSAAGAPVAAQARHSPKRGGAASPRRAGAPSASPKRGGAPSPRRASPRRAVAHLRV
ncbi:hypothetical protein KFE25_010927 [Diacronema lutheri]|uniref:Vasohibin-1 n=1 Tax=Diacronema lutheri TaxID=2081491 RepID=A0A8J6C9X6_DIALT|nr:hypothetical protein KFE25_010927 [Diacronema lutheri]